jgi:phosphoenolpyruvate-protein phosphotransferase
MKILTGNPIAPGFAEGNAFVYGYDEDCEIPHYGIDVSKIDLEIMRFHKAIENSCQELSRVRQKVMTELGEAESQIVMAHLALLEDKKFIQKVKKRVQDDFINVEHALFEEINNLVALLETMENEYIRERTEDIRDIGFRVLKHLGTRQNTDLKSLPPETVLVAGELLPSETLSLDRKHVIAIVAERGGLTSHSAILARSLGIPAIVGVKDLIKNVMHGMRIQVNGETGEVVLSPTTHRIETFSQEKTDYDKWISDINLSESEPCVTSDGVPVELFGNIGRPEEALHIKQHSLEGVGLFRTEYLFMGVPVSPDKEAQVRSYRQTAKYLGDLPLVIRTIDFGGDKIPDFLNGESEANPNIGLRGLRYSLSEKKLFCQQLEAILETSKNGNLKILFPMVLGGYDLEQAIGVVHEVARKHGVNNIPSLGAMIETPAALFSLNEILDQVDFVTLGINDLTQFMLAADRNAFKLFEDYSVLHPAVLQAILNVIETAKEKKKTVCVCGEDAGDPRVACLLVGMGVRQLSMSPFRAASVRHAIRKVKSTSVENLAYEAEKCNSHQAVEKLLQKLDVCYTQGPSANQ